jgi:uncharacterized membrane protein
LNWFLGVLAIKSVTFDSHVRCSVSGCKIFHLLQVKIVAMWVLTTGGENICRKRIILQFFATHALLLLQSCSDGM